MKIKILIFLLATLVATSSSCSVLTGKIEIDVLVHSLDLLPVENAEVELLIPYYDRKNPPRSVFGTTGKDGRVIFNETIDTPNVVQIFVRKEGFYESKDKVEYVFHDHGKLVKANLIAVKFSKQITLKQIKNPIAMYAYKNLTLTFPLNKEIGFDIKKGDLVTPYGQGEVIDFYFTMNGVKTFDPYLNKRELKINFPSNFDGYSSFRFNSLDGSDFDSPHLAPLGEYKQNFRIFYESSHSETSTQRESNIDKEKAYLFRTRTVLDENNEIIKAHYSKFYCDDIGFWIDRKNPSLGNINIEYLYFNPNNLDRNLEFDPSKNLANPDKKHRVDLP